MPDLRRPQGRFRKRILIRRPDLSWMETRDGPTALHYRVPFLASDVWGRKGHACSTAHCLLQKRRPKTEAQSP